MNTVVLQTFRTSDVPAGLESCMVTVRSWAAGKCWEYERLDDAFFDFAPGWVRKRCGENIYALTDVCRLEWLRRKLADGYERVIWADADILIFAPERIDVATRNGYAFAHELFLRVGKGGRVQPIEGLNNSLMVFEQNQTMLNRYCTASLEGLRTQPPGPVPRIALGPALLKTLDGNHHLDTINGVGLFSLAIMRQIAAGEGPLPALLARLSPAPLGAANVCHFLRNETASQHRAGFDALYERAVHNLLTTPAKFRIQGDGI